MADAPTDASTSTPAYAAVFGRNAALSAAELYALRESGGFAVSPLNRYAVELSGAFELKTADRLGGTTKIVSLEAATAPSAEAAIHQLAGTVDRPASGKLVFGISSYGGVPATPLTALMTKLLTARDIKSRYMAKRAGKSGRQPDGELSAVQVKHNRLIHKGHDWCLFETPHGWRYGRTVWVYDFEGFARRDYEKPVADAARGMLPPQLSRVMINLGTRGRSIAVYDPFCGIGGLLLESVAMGHVTYGSDLEQVAVDGAERNLEWLTSVKQGEGTGEPGNPRWELAVYDATKEVPHGEPTAIITEGSLGEPVRQSTSEADIRRQAATVTALLRGFFEQAAKIQPAGDRLVITLPVWRLRTEKLRLDLVDHARALGYTVIRPLPHDFDLPGVSDRDSIEVARPDQRVIHELFIFEKS